MKKNATIDDVAALAGLSRAQTARALRDDPCVRPETRDRVRAAARQLSYRTNVAARALSEAHSRSVGLLIGEPLNPFHLILAQAVDAALAAIGLDAIVSLRAVTDDAAATEVDRLASFRALGMILIATPRDPRAVHLAAEHLPCVYIGGDVRHGGIAVIDTDNTQGIRLAVDHLAGLGHRHIVHIGGRTEGHIAERAAAYTARMAEAGLPARAWFGQNDIDTGRRGVDALLADAPRPTAIIAANDAIAIGAIDRLHGLGLKVPEDISVIGFDDIPAAGSDTWSLTTVRQDTAALADAAVAAFQRLIKDPELSDSAASYVRLPVTLVVRRSSGPPALRKGKTNAVGNDQLTP
jgi:DNA-binding LacI/PurR family transcriptional regulator